MFVLTCQVYQALGMHLNATHDIRRSWNKPFQQPIHEMPQRTRSRALFMATPVITKVLQAFAGDNWQVFDMFIIVLLIIIIVQLIIIIVLIFIFVRRESLLFYIANNVMLHTRNKTKRESLVDRKSSYRDLVFRETLLKSQFIIKVVQAHNEVCGNERSARDERRRVLSMIALDIPYKIIQELPWRLPDVGKTDGEDRHLTKHMFSAARNHARAFTPGGNPFYIPHRKGVTITIATIHRVMSHILVDTNVQKLASGTADLVLSTGESFTIGGVARKFLRTHMWAAFVRKNMDGNGKYVGGVSRSDFLVIADNCTTEQEKCYSALDQIKVRCGSENFEAWIELVENICALDSNKFRGHGATLKGLIQKHKIHCKSVLPSHLKTTSTCGCHCLTHLFGGQGESFSSVCPPSCNGHPDHCKDCDSGRVIFLMMERMLKWLTDQGSV